MTLTTEPVAETTISLHPSEVLMNLIAVLLAPMFLGVTGGDVGLARMAAIETVNAYRASSLVDLISVALIVGYGLAALGSLSRSMDDDLSLAMILRLRGNANACSRSAEQNRRAIRASGGNDPIPHHEASAAEPEARAMSAEDDNRAPAGKFMEDTAATILAAEARDRLLHRAEKTTERAPVPPPVQVRASTVVPPATDKRHDEMWAIAMVKEASEITASIPGLPPGERRAASIRAGMLSSTANQLLTGGNEDARSFESTGKLRQGVQSR